MHDYGRYGEIKNDTLRDVVAVFWLNGVDKRETKVSLFYYWRTTAKKDFKKAKFLVEKEHQLG